MKRTLSSEGTYVLAVLLLSFAVAMIAAANFGVSMIVAPAYVLSHKLPRLTFGQCEYVVQSVVFVLFCVLMKGVRPVYFTSYGTCLLYGGALDGWRALIPVFRPGAPLAPLPLRLAAFGAGMLLTALAVALFFRTYLYPQVYDFFVREVSRKYGLNRRNFKIGFDVSFLCLAVIMTLVFFHRFVGVGPGTLVMTACNGLLIHRFGLLLDRHFLFVPSCPGLSSVFALR